MAGIDDELPAVEELLHAQKRAESTVSDDAEMEQREADLVRKAGGWLSHYADSLKPDMDRVGVILQSMGLEPEIVEEGITPDTVFPSDAKWQRLKQWISENMISGSKLKEDERLLIFTEYKDTLFYLSKRFMQIDLIIRGWIACTVELPDSAGSRLKKLLMIRPACCVFYWLLMPPPRV